MTCCGMQFWQATLVTELVVCTIVLTMVVVTCWAEFPVWESEFETTLLYVVTLPPRAVSVTVDKPYDPWVLVTLIMFWLGLIVTVVV